MKISITGDLGSGKSTVTRILNEKYGLRVYSTGSIQRQLAAERGMTTLELNKYMETHPEIDNLIDEGLRQLSDSNDDIAIDSRLAWHFTRGTFKVYLSADETVAAERVFSDSRGLSEGYSDEAEAIALIRARKSSENSRYKQMYGVDCSDMSNYDLIIDTTNILPEAVADKIMEHVNNKII